MWYAVDADLVVDRAADNSSLSVTRNSRTVQFSRQEYQIRNEHIVRTGHVQHSLQTKRHEHIYSAGKHGAYCHEFPVVRDSQLRQIFPISH